MKWYVPRIPNYVCILRTTANDLGELGAEDIKLKIVFFSTVQVYREWQTLSYNWVGLGPVRLHAFSVLYTYVNSALTYSFYF